MANYMPYTPPYAPANMPYPYGGAPMPTMPLVRGPQVPGVGSLLGEYQGSPGVSNAVAGLLANSEYIPQYQSQGVQFDPLPPITVGGATGAALTGSELDKVDAALGGMGDALGGQTLLWGTDYDPRTAMFPQTGDFLNPFGGNFLNYSGAFPNFTPSLMSGGGSGYQGMGVF